MEGTVVGGKKRRIKEVEFFKTLAKNINVEKTQESDFYGYQHVDTLNNIHKKFAKEIIEKAKLDIECLHEEFDSSEAEDIESEEENGCRVITEQEEVRIQLKNMKKLLQKYQAEKAYLEYLYLKSYDNVPTADDNQEITSLERNQIQAFTNYTRTHNLTKLLTNNYYYNLVQFQKNEETVKPKENVAVKQRKTSRKCLFVDEDHIKCYQKTMRSSNYCQKHIAHDDNQTLFRHCGIQINDVKCQESIIDYDDDARCVIHQVMQS